MSDTTAPEIARNSPGQRPAFAGFRDPTTLTKVVTWLLILCAVAKGLTGIGMGYTYYLALDNRAPDETAQTLRDGVDGIASILWLVTAIVFLRWIYRANLNSRALGAAGMRFGPGWSIGWYFVPIWNLWKPYQAMREIWKTSANPGAWQDAPTPAILRWWWMLWLLSWISFRFSATGGPSFDSDKSPGFQVVACLAEVALHLVALFLVRRITAAQLWQSQIADVF